MKIGIDARLWSETGVGRYIRNLIKELQIIDKKNEYVVFVRKTDYEKVKFQISSVRQAQDNNSNFQIIIADIRWHTLEEQVKFPQILNKEQLDLMHFPYFSIPVGYKKPFVITIHDLILNHYPTGKASTLPLPLYQLKRLGYKYVLSNAIKNAKKIIVPLNAVKGDLIQTLRVPSNKVFVTEEGVDEKISNFKFQISNSKKEHEDYFLYVGNAYPHKNIERLIQAFDQFRKNQENITLIFVGKEDYFYKKLREKVKKEKLEGIIFKHDVSDEELSYLYKNAVALIAPSFMEGFGLPALEAMALNCIVLASDIPAFQEVCKDAAIYFDPLSIDDLKEKMVSVTTFDTGTTRQYLDKGLERSREFSWRKMSEKTLIVYESCSLARSEKQ